MYSLLHADLGKIIVSSDKMAKGGFCIPPSGGLRLMVMLAVTGLSVLMLDIASSHAPDGQPDLLAQTDIAHERNRP
jgi:hypothetical protein